MCVFFCFVFFLFIAVVVVFKSISEKETQFAFVIRAYSPFEIRLGLDLVSMCSDFIPTCTMQGVSLYFRNFSVFCL